MFIVFFVDKYNNLSLIITKTWQQNAFYNKQQKVWTIECGGTCQELDAEFGKTIEKKSFMVTTWSKLTLTAETFLYSFLFTIHTQFITVEGQKNDDKLCHLDDLFPFILSVTYAITSVLTLVGVSYWSFKSLTGM